MAVTSKQFPILDLNNEALAQINGSTIKPTYDRSQLQAGIVHIGVGNFHRAHLSWYLHRLMQQGMGLPSDLVGMAMFLASEESNYVVAQTYNVDGGQWMS